MLTLKQSMELAGSNLLHCLLPAHDFLPVWGLDISPEMRAARVMSWPEHNIGRWWDAMLRLEAATGFVLPARLEAAMMRHLKSCLDNPLSVCASMNTESSCFDEHSQREILLALAMLVRCRDSDWARQAGHRMVLALDGFIRDDGTWDRAAMTEVAATGGRFVEVTPPAPEADLGERERDRVVLASTHGRMIEGLLEFYLATADAAALRLATRLADFHFAFSTRPDGTVPETEKYVHTHSLFGTYRGLLMYGELTRQRAFVERIATTYSVTVRTAVKRSGFISHDWGCEEKGETTSPGDLAQLALWLGRLGYCEFLDDAERIVRARLLPSQIQQPLGLQPADGEAASNLDDLALGAFGGMHTHPYGGVRPTTDITAADLHTLCDIYDHVVEETALGVLVNFHVDYEDERLRITSTRDTCGRLLIEPKSAQPVAVRVPAWAPRESVVLTENGRAQQLSWLGPYVSVPATEPAAPIELTYALPEATVAEQIGDTTYALTWRGDDITALLPNTDFLPFHPPQGCQLP
jgi:hypothetical protein